MILIRVYIHFIHMCIKDICVIIQKYFRKCRNIFADIAINIAFRDREIAC